MHMGRRAVSALLFAGVGIAALGITSAHGAESNLAAGTKLSNAIS